MGRKIKMTYNDIVEGIFLERPNRFIAEVLIDGDRHTVHVKNTGRCKEILIKGTKIYLQKSNNPNRKTKYSLISAYKGDRLINIDSQVPNDVVYEAITGNVIPELSGLSFVKREQKYKNSRFDMYFEHEERRGFVEVKGVTLEKDGMSMFPDAPTERGRKHIEELIDAVENGYEGYVFLLIQMEGIIEFTPNVITDPKFAAALKKAQESGVHILCYNCHVTGDRIEIREQAFVRI